MPKRTRSHQLEKESWSALDSIIPSRWVLRDPHKDYGIDGEIEIFDESGHSTGLMCFVQLKGTDENDRKKALKYRFKLETINYYRSLELPVLIIKYLSESKQLFYKWVYEIDLYYKKENSKTISIVFNENNLLKHGELYFIIDQLKIFRNLKGPKLNLPIKFHIKYETDNICNIPKGLISASILHQSDHLSEIILFDFETTDLLTPKIIIDEKLISVNIASLTSFSLHLACEYFETRDIQKMGHDIIILIALTLNQLGHSDIASELSYDHILESIFFENEKFFENQILFSILSCFLTGRRFDLAIDLANKIMEAHNDPIIVGLFVIPFLNKQNFKISDFEKIKDFIMKSIDLSIKSGKSFQAGAFHYTLAGLYSRFPSLQAISK